MKDSVIIIVSDDNYIDHAKSLAVNCEIQGGWKGDFAVICPQNSRAANEFRNHGFEVLETTYHGFLQKFDIFNSFFKKWDNALYLDCDVIVQDNLLKLFEVLKDGDLFMDNDDCTTMESFWRDPNPDAHVSVYDFIREVYPDSLKKTFNSSFILFHPSAIDEDTPKQLYELQEKINPVNNPSEGGTDQQTINLLLWSKIKKIPNKLVCYWGLSEPQFDIPSESRGWVGGEKQVALHYARWYAPHIVKNPNMDAYLNRKLKIPCHILYQQNLSKFNEIFPHI